MTPEQASEEIRKKGLKVQDYFQNKLPQKTANKVLRFVNGNFRAQGFQGTYFKKWKPSKKKKGSTLIESGRLRAGTTVSVSSEGIKIRNSMPYADVHNEGFKGKISVRAHSRNKYSKTKIGTGKLTKTGKQRKKTVTYKSGESSVKAHSKKVNIPRRQFMPTVKRPSKTLENSINTMMEKDVAKIMK